MNSNRLWMIISLMVFVFSIALIVVLFDSNKEEQVKLTVEKAIEQVQDMLPLVLSHDITWESVSVKENIVIYEYTVLDNGSNKSLLDTEELENHLLNTLCTKKMHSLEQNSYKAVYRYSNNSGLLLAQFSMELGDCI